MKTSNLLTLVGVIVVLAGICAISIKSCSEKRIPQSPTFTQLQVDSVVARYEESGKIIDQLVSQNNRLTMLNDSLENKTSETGRKLEIQGLKVTTLTRES